MFTSKTIKISGTVLFALALLVFFLPLVYLSFYSHPTSDDYFGAYVSTQYDMIPYIAYTRQTWGSRYLSYFFTKSFATNFFLFKNYHAHTLWLLAANALSCISLFKVISRYLLAERKSNLFIILSSLVYMGLQLTCLPEIWSAYYWLSGAYNHQTGVLLMHIEVAMFIVYFNTQKQWWRMFAAVVILLLVALINGVNETIILCNGALGALVFLLFAKKKDALFIMLASIIYLATMYFVVSAPGNSVRTENIPKAGVVKAIAIATGRMLFCFYNIFLNPLFWVVAAGLFGAAKRFKVNIEHFNFRGIVVKYKLLFLIIPFLVILAVLVPVMYVSNGSMPERTNNVLAQFAVLLLLFIVPFVGSFYTISLNTSKAKYVFAGLILLSLFCNRNFGEWVKSSISAKLYDDVLTQREQVLKNAKANNIKYVRLLDYNSAADSLVTTKYKDKPKTMQLIMLQRPAAIASDDDLASEENRGNLKMMYALDSLEIISKKFGE